VHRDVHSPHERAPRGGQRCVELRSHLGVRDVHDERREREGEPGKQELELPDPPQRPEPEQGVRDEQDEPHEGHKLQRRPDHRKLAPPCGQIGGLERPPGPPLLEPHQDQGPIREGAARVNEKGDDPQRVHARRIRSLGAAGRAIPMSGRGFPLGGLGRALDGRRSQFRRFRGFGQGRKGSKLNAES
jgi:hypothetical protein